MINWRRRLFRQYDPEAPVVRAKDVGFTGRAGDAVIDDQYRLKDIRAAVTAKQRANASYDWLRKIARNAGRGHDEIGDPAITEAVDEAFEAVASAIIVAADDLNGKLRKIPGMENFEDRFARHRYRNVRLTELNDFMLPGQQDPGSNDDALDDDWDWPEPELNFTMPSDDEQN